MIYFFISVITLIFLYERLTRSYVNPYKLIMVFGKKGSGKTTFLTKTAIKYVSKGGTVYSTIPIPSTILFDVKDLGKFTFKEGSLVLIDEVGMIWDNRDFKGFKPYVRDFFKLQRHYKLTVYLFSQTFDVDKKLRDLTDRMYLLKNVARVFSVARLINKNMTIQNGNEEGTSTSSLVDKYEFASILSSGAFIFTFIPRWVSFFDSYDIEGLPLINGSVVPLNAIQEMHLSTKSWFIDLAKKSFVNFKEVIFNFYATSKGLLRQVFRRAEGRVKLPWKNFSIESDVEEVIKNGKGKF